MDRNSGIFSRGDNLYKKVYTCAMFKLGKNVTNNIFFKEFGKKIKVWNGLVESLTVHYVTRQSPTLLDDTVKKSNASLRIRHVIDKVI